MNRTSTILSYLKHQWESNNRHGIHSPFVYSFLDQVLYADTPNATLNDLKQIKRQLLKDSRPIHITDLGAGSTINNQPTRLVKDIAKNSSKKEKYGKLFYRMAAHFQPDNIIELGTSLGLSTIYFSIAIPSKKVNTLEGCPETIKIAHENFNKLNINNIDTYVGDFKDTLPTVLNKVKTAGFVFFDGNHQEGPTLSYFESCLNHITDQSIFIFDDIHWSTGMQNAWQKIKGHQKTVVTLDLFFIGIVFFDSKLSPQDFKIKF
jgi:predicted O-methyltransferase YrrM